MRFASLKLNHFNLLHDSGIRELDITFTEKVQILMGSNGSGKTSVLRQLDPYPPTRSQFDKAGFKSLVVEHNGVYYRLESEFEKPSSPHLFFEGDSEDNLNVGRTTDTQKELIVEYLGITPLINDLIMNRYVFPRWSPAKRKEFLMQANPDQIGFVLTHIKQIASKIKACKNNLARLQSRKMDLEQQLLDAESLAALQQEKDTISTDLGDFQQNIMDIEVSIRTTGDTPVSFSLSDLPSIKKTIRRCQTRLTHLSHVERNDPKRQKDKERLLSVVAVCEQRLKEADEKILEHSTELNELETRYRELSFDCDLKNIDETIARLESEQAKLQVARPSFELSADELALKYQELDLLSTNLQIFSNRTITLLPTKRRQHRERMLQIAQNRQSSYRMRLENLQAQYNDLNRRHTITPKDIPDSPCAKDRCPLYSHFMDQYENTESQRQSVLWSIEKGERKIKRLDAYVEGMQNYFQQARPYTTQINWLIDYARDNPILHHLLKQLDILSVLSTNPNTISRKLHDAYDRIDQWIKLKSVQSDLETAYSLRSRQLSAESNDTIMLVSSIDTLNKTLQSLRETIVEVTQRKGATERALSDIEAFNDVKAIMLDIQATHLNVLHEMADAHEVEKLKKLQSGVLELRARHFVRMSQIETVLRSQSSLKDRYQEEVVSQITLIEEELADLEQIHIALVAIPKENMVSFINDLFKQANHFIEMIWTVPLRIEPLSIDDTLDYEFQVSGDNQSLRELGECSEGQTEILSLAINLALRVTLEHLNYPLCLDEAGRTFDDTHKQNLIVLLKRLLDDRVISQLFYVSHHAVIHEGFTDTETFVIREDNVLLPSVYNQHVTMK